MTGKTIRRNVLEHQNAEQANAQFRLLTSADITQVPVIVAGLKPYRKLVDPHLKNSLAGAADGSPEKLRLSLARLPVDDGQVGYLSRQIPVCSVNQLPVVTGALIPYREKITDGLWQLAEDEQQRAAERFQAAAALAALSPDADSWQTIAPFVSHHLTNEISPILLRQWMKLFEPVSSRLTIPLKSLHAERDRSPSQLDAAAFVLSDYLREEPTQLAELLLVADRVSEFSLLIDTLRPDSSVVHQQLLTETLSEIPAEMEGPGDRPQHGRQQLQNARWKRRALAAVSLIELGFDDEIWTLLQMSSDPSLRSFMIKYLGELEADHTRIAARLKSEK